MTRTHSLTHSHHRRTYAITWKSKWVAGILYAVTTVQFGVGLYMFIRTAQSQGQYLYTIEHALEFLRENLSAAGMSTIPLEEYHMCLPHVASTWTLVQISLAFGFGKHIVTLPNHLSNSSG